MKLLACAAALRSEELEHEELDFFETSVQGILGLSQYRDS